MIGVVTLGDCELVMLRRTKGAQGTLQVVLHTEKQRIGGHSQTPLQLARMDPSTDPNFDESDAFDAIERGSGLHCTSTYEGDIVIMGSDGVFDNLFLPEVVAICKERLPQFQGKDGFVPAPQEVLQEIAQAIVLRALSKSEVTYGRPLQSTPVGAGGKADDTSVVVAQVVEWSTSRKTAWARKHSGFGSIWNSMFCGSTACQADREVDSDPEEETSSDCWLA